MATWQDRIAELGAQAADRVSDLAARLSDRLGRQAGEAADEEAGGDPAVAPVPEQPAAPAAEAPASPPPADTPRRRDVRGRQPLRPHRTGPEAHDLILTYAGPEAGPPGPVPESVLLLRPNHADPSQDQLFIDKIPVPRDAFNYDPHDRKLTWRDVAGGGHLMLSHDGTGGHGVVGDLANLTNVEAGARAVFDVDVALDTGATYVSSGGRVEGFKWDPASPQWKNANWQAKRLRLTYTYKPGTPIDPPTFTFSFEDQLTGAIPWEPAVGEFEASLRLGHDGGRMDWDLTFKAEVPPPDDDSGSKPPAGTADSVFPYWMEAREDAAAATLTGVMEIDNLAPKGTLVGMQGVRALAHAAGYYAVSPSHAPFGIFNGKLHVGDTVLPTSQVNGRTLSWTNLDDKLAERTGLPASGAMEFDAAGNAGHIDGSTAARRLTSSSVHAAVAEHGDFHPDTRAAMAEAAEAVNQSSLNIQGLLAMNTYAQNAKGEWGDVVQNAVRSDLSTIMNSFIPAAMWNLLFPNQSQTPLTGELATVANSPVPGVSNPTAWYSSLATAVLSQGMADGSDEACKYLNGPRAGAWLKTQVGASKVYYTHGQRLFQYQWQQTFPLTAQYLADQANNAASYQSLIDQKVTEQVADINANVVVDGNSPPDLKKKLVADVQEAGKYAKDNKLFWAFAYYQYNTAPSILANIGLQMGISTGSSDGTTLTRMFQQNAAVLTAMDPSGFFSKKYTDTLNQFLAMNIVPSMYSFQNDATSYDVIKEYLETFVRTNINNEDEQIAAAAAQIKNILDSADADEMLKKSIDALRGFSEAVDEALAFPFIANKFVKWFETNYKGFATAGKIFGAVLMGGMAALSVFNLISEFRQWDKLTAAQRAEVIINAIQLALQLVAAVVKRGVRVYALWSLEGITGGQRAAGIARILAQGESEDLDWALSKIGNSTARWLGDTEGSLAANLDEELIPLLRVGEEAAAEEAGWLTKIFGNNLDEFIATRLGPLFILAGIGLSIYFIASGEGGVALASDILNIISGSLMLFATIGGWLIEGGVIAAEGIMATVISFAGPLAIIVALAGIALLLYEMFKKPPDPVQEFVDQYAKPAGFAVGAKDSAIDYVRPYANNDAGKLMMLGATFGQANTPQVMVAQNDGTIALGAANSLPATVWQVATDGLGMSQIYTIVQPDSTQPPVVRFLTKMSDGSVSFQKKLPRPGKPLPLTPPNALTPVSQTWYSTPEGSAAVTSDGNLKSLTLVLQVVNPDGGGKLAPSGAGEYLAVSGGTVVLQSAKNASPLVITMSGIAPNYMSRPDIKIIENSTPSTAQKWSPLFGILPSTPITTKLTGTLPSFLQFDGTSGAISPTGGTATPASSNDYTETVSNALGTESVGFKIVVAAPTST